MNSWHHLLTSKIKAPVKGEWFCVRFCPDKVTGELFNVGVVFIDQDGKCHAKLLESPRIFEHMFGNLGVSNISFLLTVVAETLADNHFNISPSSHIIYSRRQTAQGESIAEILDDLYHSMISLVSLPQDEKDKKRDVINTKELRQKVASFIKKEYPDTYYQILRDTPLAVSHGGSQVNLDIPLVHKNLSKEFYGTVVSADYLDAVHFYYNVEHIGVSNLASCCEILGKNIKSGISIYNPPMDSKADQSIRDERIDKSLLRLQRLRKNGYDIDIRIESDINKCITTSIEMAA